MSTFGGQADMTLCGNPLLRSLLGVKWTWLVAAHMSAFDPKRILPSLISVRVNSEIDLMGVQLPFLRQGLRDGPHAVDEKLRGSTERSILQSNDRNFETRIGKFYR
jgi:hypothetical protein